MIELPEAMVMSGQLQKELAGKLIEKVVVGKNPHKFAWFTGKPEDYSDKLVGRKVVSVYPKASRIFIELDNGMALVLGEGTRLSWSAPLDKRPEKHQLQLDFTDGTSFTVTIQMYGFILLEKLDDITNKYVVSSIEKPSPLSAGFNRAYFNKLFNEYKKTNLSTKAFLTTEQRIPGIGNGVLQDILFNALIHPRLKLKDYKDEESENLFNSIKVTLKDMTDKGGRNTETDIYGQKGGYETMMSKKTAGRLCPTCGRLIEKQSYMGGSVYVCPKCQRKE